MLNLPGKLSFSGLSPEHEAGNRYDHDHERCQRKKNEESHEGTEALRLSLTHSFPASCIIATNSENRRWVYASTGQALHVQRRYGLSRSRQITCISCSIARRSYWPWATKRFLERSKSWT